MAFLKPQMLNVAGLKDVQAAARKDLLDAQKAAKDATFVVAQGVKLGDGSTTSLFIALKTDAESKAWSAALKEKHPVAIAVGTCAIGKDGNIAIKKVAGASTDATVKLATAAVHPFPGFTASNATEAPEHETDDEERKGFSLGPEVRRLKTDLSSDGLKKWIRFESKLKKAVSIEEAVQAVPGPSSKTYRVKGKKHQFMLTTDERVTFLLMGHKLTELKVEQKGRDF